MKTHHITLFLTTGVVIEINRLTKKKIDTLKDIISSPPEEMDLFFPFKHEGSTYFIQPNKVAIYVTKSTKVAGY